MGDLSDKRSITRSHHNTGSYVPYSLRELRLLLTSTERLHETGPSAWQSVAFQNKLTKRSLCFEDRRLNSIPVNTRDLQCDRLQLPLNISRNSDWVRTGLTFPWWKQLLKRITFPWASTTLFISLIFCHSW